MNFIKCNLTHLDELIEIGRQTYYDTFHKSNDEAVILKYLDKSFEIQKIKAELVSKTSSYYFLYDKGKVVAYIKINFAPTQTDLNQKDTLELERIYVKKDYKGFGYGTILINKVLFIASECECTYVWLGVWEGNIKALEFYQKLGFKIFDKHIFKMGDTVDTDFLLKKYL